MNLIIPRMNLTILHSKEGVTSLVLLYYRVLLRSELVGWNKLAYNNLGQE